jgi:PAS domain S-box-containing protein
MKHIIIADDRIENRYMLESLLKGVEYNITTAKNGLEALAFARKTPPDLIISDILMPVMDGFTLCKEWRKDETLKNIPLIFYTAAYTNPQDISYALRLGADKYLIKPQEPSEFLSIIKQVLYESELGLIEAKPVDDKSETEYLKEYNAVLFRKLEDKLLQAEMRDRRLKQNAAKLEQNIQKLKLSEENLRQTHDYLDNLIDYANAPIIVWNPQFNVIRFNHAFEHLTGYSASEVLGQKLDMLFPEDTLIDSLAQTNNSLGGQHWESVEFPILTKSNEIRIILWNSASIYDREGNKVISTIAQGQDITERKHTEEALKASEAKLKDLNATKDKFFSIIAHDLRSPFNGILGFSNLLKEDAYELNPETIIEYGDLINRAALQVFRLLDNLLTWARVQQGQLAYNPTPLTLKKISHEVIELMFENANTKRITVKDNIPDGLMVNADSDMLKSIVRNLVSNAIKFTPPNGKVELNAVEHDQQVEISVKDSGKGIPEDSIDKLFNIDTNFSTRGTAGEEGTGLGLILAKEFVEKHSGKVWAESREGQGSVFHFTIPKYNKTEKDEPIKMTPHHQERNINQRA